jgi:hypothetical protein
MAAKKLKLSDFRSQSQNANKHTERGIKALNKAINEDGWITAITVTADGEAIDGSARLETAYKQFGDIEPIVVRSNGDRPIIHVREDLATADDPKAKKLSVEANRIAFIDLDWDAEVLDEISGEVDLTDLFTDKELESILIDNEEPEDIEPDEERSGSPGNESAKPVESTDQTYLLKDLYKVIVECESESEQIEVLDKLLKDGHKCRALIS